MASADPGASVLIVDGDPGIRRLIAAVLEHSGFHTVAVDDPDAVAMLAISKFEVIVRDLNLAPGASRRSLQQLAATAPELLRRTIVLTTAAARAETAVCSGTVFAIVSKPFDIADLVTTVRACARGACAAVDPEPRAPVKIESLRPLVASVPSLQRLLSAPVGGQHEAVLRAEMRRTLGALAATLTEAAHAEANGVRATVFRAASSVIARLATGPAPASAVTARKRDH